MVMGEPAHSFWLLLDGTSRIALPNEEQPLSKDMSKVLKKIRDIRRSGRIIAMAVVYPGSKWEKQCKCFPRGYPIETLQAKIKKGIQPKGR